MTPVEVHKVEWSKSKNSTENKNSRFWSQICDYCENTSLHGYRYLTLQSIHWVERLLWLMVHITAICAVSYIISELWDEYVSSPTITTVETANYPIWHVPFPAVAVCNINKISRKAAWELAEELSGNGSSNVEHTFHLLRYLGRLYDHEDQDLDMYDELHAILTADIDEEDEHLNETYFKNMKKLSPSCEELLVRCRWLGHIENCSKIFTPRVTMEGFCCTFNYIRDSDDFLTAEEDAILEENEEAEHHGDEEDEDEEEEEGGHHEEGDELLVSAPGYEMGLSILVNPQLEDYYYPLIATYGIKILVFKSRDFPDTPSGGLIEKIVAPKREVFFRLEASSIYADSFVERFDLKQRGCIFRNELTGLFVDSYSFSDCLMDCRGRSIQALCQCIPFYLPSRGVHRDCDARDIPCLARHKEKWWTIRPTFSDPALRVEMEEAISCPDCFPTCDDITYEVQSAEAYLSGRRFNHSGFLEDIELQNHSVVHVFFGSKNSIRLKQDILFYWYDLLSNFGSILGLFVGFSLLSIVEIVYFFTLRFYYALRSPRTSDVTPEKTDITGPTKLKVNNIFIISSDNAYNAKQRTASIYWHEITQLY